MCLAKSSTSNRPVVCTLAHEQFLECWSVGVLECWSVGGTRGFSERIVLQGEWQICSPDWGIAPSGPLNDALQIIDTEINRLLIQTFPTRKAA